MIKVEIYGLPPPPVLHWSLRELAGWKTLCGKKDMALAPRLGDVGCKACIRIIESKREERKKPAKEPQP